MFITHSFSGDDTFSLPDKLLVLFEFPNDPDQQRFNEWAKKAHLIVNRGIGAQEFLDYCLLAFHCKYVTEIHELERKNQKIVQMMAGNPELIRVATQQVLDIKHPGEPVGMAVDGVQSLTV